MARRALKQPEARQRMSRLGPDPKQVKALAGVASRFAGFKPAAQVLLEVEAVPTCFPQLNRVSKIGGWPIARFSLIHGPSNEGKTELVHGVGGSFLGRGHFYALIDAEHTTPHSWVRSLVGSFADSPGFVASRPRTYEETVQAVRDFCTTVAMARDKQEVDEATTAFIVVDSLRKLVPKKMLDELMKDIGGDDDDRPGRKSKPKGIDGAGGRAGQIKAMLNAAWLDELIPLLAQTRVGMAVISRETEVESENPFASGPTFKVGGGKAPYYDSSLVARVTRDSFLYERKYEQGKPPPAIVGERRAIEIHKTKVAGRDERWPTAYYHTSNGKLSPVGFDVARDILELAQDMGFVELNGSWFSFGGQKLAQGQNATLALLRSEPETLDAITQAIAEFDERAKARDAAALTG